MDILYSCTLYPPAVGGAQIHLHCLAQQMKNLGNRVQVLTSCTRNRTDWLRMSTFAPEPRKSFVCDGVDVVQLTYPISSRLKMLPWAMGYYALLGPAVRRIAKLIDETAPWPDKTPTLVHASRVGREFLTRASLDYARKQGIPFVLTPNHHPRWDGYPYREYDKIYRESDAVIALTESERELLIRQKGVRPERIHVTGIGPVLSPTYSADSFREKYAIDGRFVLYLGQQLKYKGVGLLIEAAPAVWQQHPDVKIVFIGPRSTYADKLFSRVQDKRLINLGSVDLQTKTSALAACEFLCLPSTQESFGGVFVEAWSQQKAVIGGRIPPIANVVEDGRDGLLTSPSADELAAAINRLLTDRDACASMGHAGWQKVQARYSWDRLAQQTMEIYKACGASNGPSEVENALTPVTLSEEAGVPE